MIFVNDLELIPGVLSWYFGFVCHVCMSCCMSLVSMTKASPDLRKRGIHQLLLLICMATAGGFHWIPVRNGRKKRGFSLPPSLVPSLRWVVHCAVHCAEIDPATGPLDLRGRVGWRLVECPCRVILCDLTEFRFVLLD